MSNKKQVKNDKNLKKKKAKASTKKKRKVIKRKVSKLNKIQRVTRDKQGRKTKFYRPYVKRAYKLTKPRVIPNYFYFRGYLSSFLKESGTDWRKFGNFNKVSSILWKSLLSEQKADLGYLKNNIDQIWSEIFKGDLKVWQKELEKFMELNYSLLNWWLTKDMVTEVSGKESYRYSQCSFSFADGNGEVIDEIINSDVYNNLIFLQMRRDIDNMNSRYGHSSEIYYEFIEVAEVDGKLVIYGKFPLYYFPINEVDLKKLIKDKAKEEKEKGETQVTTTPPSAPPSESIKLKELEIELEKQKFAVEKEKTRQLELENEKLNKISEMIKDGFTKQEIMKILGK